MPYQQFLLKTDEPGFEAARAALKALTDAKAGFTTTQVQRPAAHDSSLVVISANVTEAELDAHEDLVDLRTANFSTALCRDRFVDLADFRTRGFQTLGESERSSHGYPGQRRRVFRRVASGAGNGYTHFDAETSLTPNLILAGLTKVWHEDVSTATFTDQTSVAGFGGGSDWALFPASPEPGDRAYFAYTAKFNTLEVIGTVRGTGTYTVAWEYWDGDSWSALSVNDGTGSFKSGKNGVAKHVSFIPPEDWAAVEVNGSGGALFYIRCTLDAGTMTVAPLAEWGRAHNYDVTPALIELCGEWYLTKDGGPGSTFVADLLFFANGSADEADAVTLRMDHPLDMGFLHDGALIKNEDLSSTHFAWVSAGDLAPAGCYIKGDWARPEDEANPFGIGINDGADVTGLDLTQNSAALSRQQKLSRAAEIADLADVSECGKLYKPTGDNAFSAPFGDPDAVFQDDGGAYTDYTAEAAAAGGADVNLFPASPATGDRLVVGHDELWNVVRVNVSTASVGTYTLTPKYWNGSTMATFPAGTSAWRSDAADFKGTGDRTFYFTPPGDWVKTSINGSASLYFVVFELTAGTMTTPPVANTVDVGGCYTIVHIYGDVQPGIDGVEILRRGLGPNINIRQYSRCGVINLINCNAMGGIKGFAGEGYMPRKIRVMGGRYLHDANYLQNGICDLMYYGPSTDGRILYDTSNRGSYADYLGFQELVDRHGADPDDFTADAVSRWVELKGQRNGPYPAIAQAPSGHDPGFPVEWHVESTVIDETGGVHFGHDYTNNDMHCLAVQGGWAPAVMSRFHRILMRKVHAAIYFYRTSDTTERCPIDHNAAAMKNSSFRDIVIDGYGGGPIGTAGHFGINFGGNNYGVESDNGSGEIDNWTVRRYVCLNLNDDHTVVGNEFQSPDVATQGALIFNWNQWRNKSDNSLIYDQMSVIDTNCVISGNGKNGPFERPYIKVDDGGAFTDYTSNNYSGTPFQVFPAAPAVNDAIYFGRVRDSFRRMKFTISTGASATYAGVWEYFNGSWTAVPTSGTWADGTSGFAAAAGGDKVLAFDRPEDWATTTVDGETMYWLRFRLTSVTSFTTVPQISFSQTISISAAMEIGDNVYFENVGYLIAIRNGAYAVAEDTYKFDNWKGKLKPGETIATKKLFRDATFGGERTLAEVQAGTTFNKLRATSDAPFDMDILPSVSQTPGVDIVEVAA